MKNILLLILLIPLTLGAQTVSDSQLKLNTDYLIRKAGTVTRDNHALLNDQITDSKVSVLTPKLGISSNIGYVWTATDLLGNGSWQMLPLAVSTFQGLTDGPGNYSGHSLNYTRVNVGSSLLEYRNPSQVLSDISGVPNSRQLTINGTTFDLSADRSWTIASSVTSFNSRTGVIIPQAGDYSGTQLNDWNISSPSNSQFLQYQTSDSKWHNHSLVLGDIGGLGTNWSTALGASLGSGWTTALNSPYSSSGGVNSFNSRTGSITPQLNDYSSFYLPLYTWTEQFDDDIRLSTFANGYNNNFTLSNSPTLENIKVFKNGIQLAQNQFSLSGTSLTVTDFYNQNIGTTSITQSGTVVTVVTTYPYFDLIVGSIISVSGTGQSQMNGTFAVTSVSGGTFTYTATSSATVSTPITNATINFFKPPSKKDIISAKYSSSTAQSTPTRYNTGNLINLVFYGNSLFYGVGSQHNISDVVTQLKAMLPTIPFITRNMGTPGITTQTLNSQINSVLAPQLSNSYSSNIIVVSEIVNDYAANHGSLTNTQIFNNYKALCQNIKALNAAYKIIACTILNGALVAESDRVAINNMIIADNSFYDGLVDITSDSNIGVAGASSNTTYFVSDAIHLYPDGYYDWAVKMYPVIMNVAGLTIQNISTVPIQTSSTDFHDGGNFDAASITSKIIGSARQIPIQFNTWGLNRGNIGANGVWTVNPSVTKANVVNGAIVLSPTITGTNSNDVQESIVIQPNYNTTSFLTQNILRVRNTSSVDVLTVTNNNIAYSKPNFDVSNANLKAGNLIMSADINSLSAPTSGMINFTSGGDGTGNSYYIGKNSSNLYYNVANTQQHIFTVAGTAAFSIGTSNQATGPYAANFVITGQADLPVTTKKGLIFNAPGGTGNDVIITRASTNTLALIYKVGSTGNHLFAVGDNAQMTLTSNGLYLGGTSTSPTAKLHLAAGTTTANTAPIQFTAGTNETTARAGLMEYDGTNLFFTRTGTIRGTLVQSDAVNAISPTSPNRTITVNIGGTTYYIAAKTTND